MKLASEEARKAARQQPPQDHQHAEWGRRGQVVEHALLLRGIWAGKVDEARRVDRARADDVHADPRDLRSSVQLRAKLRTAAFEAL